MAGFDFVVPGAIIAFCALVIIVVYAFTRPRPEPWELQPPEREPTRIPEPLPYQPPVDALTQWHREHEATVAAWIETHERMLEGISAAGMTVDLNDQGRTEEHEQLAEAMRAAITSHPAPAMQAELSALQVAGEASLFALSKGNLDTAHRQHLTYLEYRDRWIDRLRQFSADEARMADLRQSAAANDEARNGDWLDEEP